MSATWAARENATLSDAQAEDNAHGLGGSYGGRPLGSFGAVVGATIDGSGLDFAINGPILAPGYGEQGGTSDSNAAGRGASRERAGQFVVLRVHRDR